MSSWPSSRSWERGTAVPLIKPRERPSLLMTRRSKHSRPSSSWFASSQRRAAGVSLTRSGRRDRHGRRLCAPYPPARPPRHKPRASMAMDLPAPVSPVIAVIPLWKSISSSRTMAKLLMVSCASIIVFLYENHNCVCIQYKLVLYTVKCCMQNQNNF